MSDLYDIWHLDLALVGAFLGVVVLWLIRSSAAPTAGKRGSAATPDLSAAMALVSVTGVWLTVPDTEVPVLLGSAGVVVFGGLWATGWVTPRSRSIDELAGVTIVGIGTLAGASSLQSALAGLACGALLWVPTRRPRDLADLIAHTSLVVVGSRVCTRVGPAVALAAWLGTAGVVGVVLYSYRRKRVGDS